MQIEKDYEELLGLLNRHEVRYCIVGAYALALHTKPRYTKDMDLFVDPTPLNAERILAALQDFGFGSLNLTENDFTEKGQIIQLGFEPVRVDILTDIKGVSFDEVWQQRVTANYGKIEANFINLENLIKSKRSSGRAQDYADLQALERVRRTDR